MRTMTKDPASRIQDYLVFGEFGGVNPSITDSSTFTFLTSEKMEEIFEHEIEGCYLYSRHLNPMNNYLAHALALLENTEDAHVTATGMAAISCAILQICASGDEIVSSRTIYGGTYAIMKNFFPTLGINTKFVDITNLEQVKAAITPNTKVLYCETLSNPMLELADIPELRKIADEHGLKLIVDNTFTPMIFAPADLGAHIVIHSLTKFINGASDAMGGVICADHEFTAALKDVNSGAAMLLGPAMDSLRAASILKNMRTLHVRMVQHSKNAAYIANKMHEKSLKVTYTGLDNYKYKEIYDKYMHPDFGYGGMVVLDAGDDETAGKLMPMMQERLVGYFAVSLGFYKTLFSGPGHSTSSEIPEKEREAMGMSGGLVRFSFGLDNNIERTWERIEDCLKDCGLL
jgi:methionine-gamma-lyase